MLFNFQGASRYRSSRQLDYYITQLPLCQYFFESFLKTFSHLLGSASHLFAGGALLYLFLYVLSTVFMNFFTFIQISKNNWKLSVPNGKMAHTQHILPEPTRKHNIIRPAFLLPPLFRGSFKTSFLCIFSFHSIHSRKNAKSLPIRRGFALTDYKVILCP